MQQRRLSTHVELTYRSIVLLSFALSRSLSELIILILCNNCNFIDYFKTSRISDVELNNKAKGTSRVPIDASDPDVRSLSATAYVNERIMF